MAPDPPDAAGTSFWAASREHHRIRREIIFRVHRGRHGKTSDAIADELRREFAAARMAEPPEQVREWAEAIERHRWPGTHFLGQFVDLVVHRRTPSWVRLEEQRLPGTQWVPVHLAGTPLAQLGLRRHRRLPEMLDTVASLRARLISTPGIDGERQIAVLLGSDFAGTLDADHAIAVMSAVDEAERANRKLTVESRVDEAGGLFVSVPDPFAV